MDIERELARWRGGWRGPALAAFIAFLAALPGVIAVPPLDRDEARFAQATSQMLETRDFVEIRYLDEPRFKKLVGIYWLQSASVSLLSSYEAREIWAFRIPSLLGTMVAAAACAWGAAAFFGPAAGVLAGALLGGGVLLSTEAMIAKTDSALCGATALALAALAHIYRAAREGVPPRPRWVLTFWIALAVGILLKGPIAPAIAALTLLTLVVLDRRVAWVAGLGWYWGLVIVLLVVGPWAGAVTVATDGQFWDSAAASELSRVVRPHEGHGAPPGYHLLAAVVLMFPMTLMVPAAATGAWRRRDEPGVRFAIAWLVPAWIMLELSVTKLAQYPLPLYAAAAWLAAAAAGQPVGRAERWLGAALSALFAVLAMAGCAWLFAAYGDGWDVVPALLAAALLGAAGLVGAHMLLREQPSTALICALVLGVLGHAMLTAGLIPRLDPLWVSHRTETAMAAARLLPRQGVAEAPVAVTGYAEPSLVFALGSGTELTDAAGAARAIAELRPAVVEAREDAAFHRQLRRLGARARLVGEVDGLNYSRRGDKTLLRIYEAAPAQETAP